MAITPLPDPPSTSDPANFESEADAFLGALPTFVTEANALTDDISSAVGGVRWNFDSSTTMADPGTGDFRLNHATVANATAIAVSASSADSGNPAVRPYVLTWDDSTGSVRGTIMIRKIGTPATYAVFNVTGALTDNTTWVQLAVTYVGGNGALSNADELVITFARAGNDGDVTAGGAITLTNKKLDSTTTRITDTTDPSKTIVFDVSAIGSATTATFSFPSAGGTLVTSANIPGGDVVLVSSASISSGVASVTINLSTAYDEQIVELRNVNSNTGNMECFMYAGSGIATNSYDSVNLQLTSTSDGAVATAFTGRGNATAFREMPFGNSTNATTAIEIGLDSTITITNITSSKYKKFHASFNGGDHANSVQYMRVGEVYGMFKSTAQLTQITVKDMSGVLFGGGKVKVWGKKNA